MPYVNSKEMVAVEHEPGLFARKLVDGARGARGIALLSGWLEPGASHAPHTHEIEEAVVFLSGRGVVSIEAERFDVGPGDAVLIPAGAVHSTTNGERLEPLHFVAAFPDSVVRSRPAPSGATPRSPLVKQRWATLWNQIRWISRQIRPR